MSTPSFDDLIFVSVWLYISCPNMFSDFGCCCVTCLLYVCSLWILVPYCLCVCAVTAIRHTSLVTASTTYTGQVEREVVVILVLTDHVYYWLLLPVIDARHLSSFRFQDTIFRFINFVVLLMSKGEI